MAICPSRQIHSTLFTAKAVLNHVKNTLPSGFKTITFRDDSPQFLIYVQAFLDNLETQRAYIEENFGEELFTYLKDDHEKLFQNIQGKNKIATRITAKK